MLVSTQYLVPPLLSSVRLFSETADLMTSSCPHLMRSKAITLLLYADGTRGEKATSQMGFQPKPDPRLPGNCAFPQRSPSSGFQGLERAARRTGTSQSVLWGTLLWRWLQMLGVCVEHLLCARAVNSSAKGGGLTQHVDFAFFRSIHSSLQAGPC